MTATEAVDETPTGADLVVAWPLLSKEERHEAFLLLSRPEAENVLLALPARDQVELLDWIPTGERRAWLRLLPPDDSADLLRLVEPDVREELLALLDPPTRMEVLGLLAYDDDQAGGLMNPHYARLRPEMTVLEANSYLRRYAHEHRDSTYYAYVLDTDQHLLGTVSFRDLFAEESARRIGEIMHTKVVRVGEEMDQEAVSRLFAVVVRRELGAGIVLGALLGSIGVVRILAWQGLFHPYGEHYALVDVTGLVIYFSVATVVLRGTLL